MFWKSFYADDIQPEIQVAPPGMMRFEIPENDIHPDVQVGKLYQQ